MFLPWQQFSVFMTEVFIHNMLDRRRLTMRSLRHWDSCLRSRAHTLMYDIYVCIYTYVYVCVYIHVGRGTSWGLDTYHICRAKIYTLSLYLIPICDGLGGFPLSPTSFEPQFSELIFKYGIRFTIMIQILNTQQLSIM